MAFSAKQKMQGFVFSFLDECTKFKFDLRFKRKTFTFFQEKSRQFLDLGENINFFETFGCVTPCCFVESKVFSSNYEN
jgi:hypothetical protein